MTTLNIEGRKVKVSDDFLSLPPDEQERTVDEIAASLKIEAGPKHPVMSRVNQGIAESVGGLVDFVNPFDEYTGSATTGLKSAMRSGGIEVGEGQPDTISGAMALGAGQAAGSLVPVAKGLQALRGAGGALGQFADDAFRAIASFGGAGAEVAAGAISGGAEEVTEQAGAPEWVQNTAAIAAPMAIPAAAEVVKGAAKLGPTGTLVRRAGAALAPYTNAGAKGVATERMQALSGGRERAEELAGRIGNDNPLGLSPAQQTGDENMLAVERLAAEQDPELRAYLEQRRRESAGAAQDGISEMGGDVEDTQRFIQARRTAFADELRRRTDEAMTASGQKLSSVGDGTPESVSGTRIANEVRSELQKQVQIEREMWGAVPKDVLVSTSSAKSRYSEIVKSIPRAQRDDIPDVARRLLSAETNDAFSDSEAAAEIHGLYSKLREVARNARAGETPNRNTARIADDLADALLVDLEASAAGEAFGEAVAFTRALHDVYDQGAVSKILKRSRSGVTMTEPEAAAARTVGRGGVEGMVASRQLEEAGARSETVKSYIANQFSGSAINAGTGEVTIAGARRFVAKNTELLTRYPELKSEIDSALAQKVSADEMAARVEKRLAALVDKRRSVASNFADGQAEKAFEAITGAKNPVQAARRVANEARKDPSGKALDGLKGAFADHLIASGLRTKGAETGLDASALNRALSDPRTARAMGQIFSEAEMSRLRFFGKELAKAQAATTANIGSELSGARANRLVEWVARIGAARHGAALGGSGGGSLQTAQMASSRVKELLNHLASDKASQMMADAVRDPELFKALLTQTGSARGVERAAPLFLPYLVGGASGAAQ